MVRCLIKFFLPVGVHMRKYALLFSLSLVSLTVMPAAEKEASSPAARSIAPETFAAVAARAQSYTAYADASGARAQAIVARLNDTPAGYRDAIFAAAHADRAVLDALGHEDVVAQAAPAGAGIIKIFDDMARVVADRIRGVAKAFGLRFNTPASGPIAADTASAAGADSTIIDRSVFTDADIMAMYEAELLAVDQDIRAAAKGQAFAAPTSRRDAASASAVTACAQSTAARARISVAVGKALAAHARAHGALDDHSAVYVQAAQVGHNSYSAKNNAPMVKYALRLTNGTTRNAVLDARAVGEDLPGQDE